jgi:peptide deformylase
MAPVVVLSTTPGSMDYLTLYNPRVIEVSTQTEKGEEGSVSLPGVRVELERPVWAVVEFMDAQGRPQTTRLEGFAARVALHEIEQTQGNFFLDKVSRLKRDMALKKARKHSGS